MITTHYSPRKSGFSGSLQVQRAPQTGAKGSSPTEIPHFMSLSLTLSAQACVLPMICSIWRNGDTYPYQLFQFRPITCEKDL